MPNAPKYAFVRFTETGDVVNALALANTPLMGLLLKITPASSNDLPDLDPTPLGLLPTPGYTFPSGSNVLPTTPVTSAQQQDEIARTVYVGNVNSKISSEQLMTYFAMCGPITYCRMAGDETHPSRFAFLEFATIPAAQGAKALSGSILMDRPIKVNHSKNPIVKPPKVIETAKDEEIMRKVRKAIAAITRRIQDGKDDGSDDGDSYYNDRNVHDSRVNGEIADHSHRKRSKSRDKRSRSRDRDRDRKRRRSGDDRDRDRDRDRRDRDRDRGDRYRDRDRRRSDDRDRDRHRDRDRRRSDDRDRDRHRDRDNRDNRESERDRRYKETESESSVRQYEYNNPTNGDEDHLTNGQQQQQQQRYDE